MIDTVVDFETYYDKHHGPSASTQGVYNYVHDPESYAYILSVRADDLHWVGTIEDALKHPVIGSKAFWDDRGRTFWAANSNFDKAWADRYFQESPGAALWECVIDRAAVQQLPGNLTGIVKQVFGAELDKGLRDKMNGVHWRDLDAGEKAAMLRYCAEDARWTYELVKKLPAPSSFEQDLARHTRQINSRGVRIDVDKAGAYAKKLEQVKFDAQRRIPWTGLEKNLSRDAFDDWCNHQGIAAPKSLAQTDEECARMCASDPRLNEVVQAMRTFRKANASITKVRAILDRVRPDGYMPMELIYCGARHTRRWASRGVNVHNLARDPLDLGVDANGDSVLDEDEAIWLRELLIPAEGHEFYVPDFSQVEPRCLHWLTGNEPLLKKIREGYGIYEAYARANGLWTRPEPLKETDKLLYKSIKAQVLGLGYGMGWAKYQATAALDGIILTEQEARSTVAKFREQNPGIPELWGKLDGVIRKTTQDKDKELAITLPTGDVLRYFSVTFNTKTKSYQGLNTKGVHTNPSLQLSLWGGSLTENCIQRFARDVLGNAILRLESAGFPVRFHVHDEVILERPLDLSDKAKADWKHEVDQIMLTAPEWAPGLPLASEGVFAAHYVK